MPEEPGPAGESPRLQRNLALLAVVGTIAGAAIGGLIAAGTSYYLDKASADRQRKGEERVARGIARVMLGDFQSALNELCRIGDTGYFLREPVHLRSEVSIDDRRLLASELSPDAWFKVSAADLDLETWDTFYRAPRYREPGVFIDPGQGPRGWYLGVPVTEVERASDALIAYASPDTSPVSCDRSKWVHPSSVVRAPPTIRRHG
jgi:hypothetical protein